MAGSAGGGAGRSAIVINEFYFQESIIATIDCSVT